MTRTRTKAILLHKQFVLNLDSVSKYASKYYIQLRKQRISNFKKTFQKVEIERFLRKILLNLTMVTDILRKH